MSILLDHQLQAVAKLRRLQGKAGLFVSMGGGKTRVALVYARLEACQRILVVLPISVTSVWEREAGLLNYPVPVVDLTAIDGIKERTAKVKSLGVCVLLVNYESYWREPLRSAIVKWAPDCVILDEAHRIRNRGSRQARFAHVLATKPSVRVRLALSGTPVTNGIQDVWSLYRFIDPTLFANWQQFAARYILFGGYLGKQIIGYVNQPELQQTIERTSFQWEGDLPAPPDVPIRVRLTPKTRKVYDELRKKAIVEVQSLQGDDRHTVLARIVLTLLLRLQQITSGFATDVGEEEVPVGEEKADATIDLVSDALAEHRRVVVFVRFTYDLRLLLGRMRAQGWRVGYIDGSVPPGARKELIQDFDTGHYDVLIAQIKAASLGIDLASASVGIFYSVGFSLDEFLQAKGRLSGALRQRHPVTFYHMLVEKSVDEQIYAALSAKTQIARQVTSLSYALALFGAQP